MDMSIKGLLYAFLAVFGWIAMYGIGISIAGDNGGTVGAILGFMFAACMSWLSQGKSIKNGFTESVNEFIEASKSLIMLGLIILAILAVIAIVMGVFSWFAGLSATTVIIILLVLILLK